MKFDDFLKQSGEVGFVVSVAQTVVLIEGLPGAVLEEELIFESGQTGGVASLSQNSLEALVLSTRPVKVGTRVAKTGKKLAVKVGEHLLGKTVNSVGKIIGDMDSGRDHYEQREIDIHAPGISYRAKVSRILETGVAIIDLMIPIGRGQRELVMGDRKTGKSSLLMKAAIAQASSGGVCVFAMIGKQKQAIRQAEEYFKSTGALPRMVMVASSSHDSPGEIHLTPFTAMTVAEYFRDRGIDVLLVLDDMSTHAKFYREVALLGRRFPGRDSYPGDIFYTHSRLLERAGNFIVGGKEVAITCLPVVETVQGDLTGYIQTNLMSMTDGHIYFDSDLYFAGRRPAVNIFLSVTRVGHQTQSKLRREMHRVTLDLMANYARVQDFIRFGADLGDNSRQVLALGDKLLSFFNQPRDSVIPISVQTILWAMLWLGVWDGSNTAKMVEAYNTDPKLNLLINNIITNADSVNLLLSKVSAQSELLLNILNSAKYV